MDQPIYQTTTSQPQHQEINNQTAHTEFQSSRWGCHHISRSQRVNLSSARSRATETKAMGTPTIRIVPPTPRESRTTETKVMGTPTIRVLPPNPRESRPTVGEYKDWHRPRTPSPHIHQPMSPHWNTHLLPTAYVQTKDGGSMNLSPQVLNHPAYPYVRTSRSPSLSSAPQHVHSPCPRCLKVHGYLVFPEHVMKIPLGERIKRWLRRNGCRIKDGVVEGCHNIEWKLHRK